MRVVPGVVEPWSACGNQDVKIFFLPVCWPAPLSAASTITTPAPPPTSPKPWRSPSAAALLHQCDAHLEWTRLHLATHHDADARRHLAIAKGLVEQTGYHRRDADVALLEERLAASGSRG